MRGLDPATRLELGTERRGDCLFWVKGKMPNGYGSIGIKGKTYTTHRVACALAHGPAPEGKPMALHTCDNKPCVEPSHLYWGDQYDNMRDRAQRTKWKKIPKTHCKRGHEFSEENTHIRAGDGARECRICGRLKQQRFYYKNRVSA